MHQSSWCHCQAQDSMTNTLEILYNEAWVNLHLRKLLPTLPAAFITPFPHHCTSRVFLQHIFFCKLFSLLDTQNCILCHSGEIDQKIVNWVYTHKWDLQDYSTDFTTWKMSMKDTLRRAINQPCLSRFVRYFCFCPHISATNHTDLQDPYTWSILQGPSMRYFLGCMTEGQFTQPRKSLCEGLCSQ